MRRTVVIVCLAACLGLAATNAGATGLSWQTEPILGYSVSNATGDVVVVTGPQPLDGLGNPYYDVDGNPVMGPTIPHYSIAGDPLYGIGGPSVTKFYVGPFTVDPVYGLCDVDTFVCSGSGVNLVAGNTYHYKGVYTLLGPGGYDLTVAENGSFSTSQSFIMLMTSVGYFWPSDVGDWKYTETWEDLTAGGSISSTRYFCVAPVPEPLTMTAVFMSVCGLGAYLRKRAKTA